MVGPRVIVGWVLAVFLVGMSVNSFVTEGALTSEAWGFLLLTPLALMMALNPTVPWENTDSEGVEEWPDDEGSEEGEKDVPDPIESGFDIPVL
jgi:hypothetical protein